MADNKGRVLTQSRVLSLVHDYVEELSKTAVIQEISISIVNSQLRFEIKGESSSENQTSLFIVSTYTSKIGIKTSTEQTEPYVELYFLIKNKSPPIIK